MGQNLTGQLISATYEDLVQISGSVFTDGLGNDITSVDITASNAVSSSFALTASFALNAGTTVDTGSLMVTGSVSSNTLTFTKGDGSTFNLTVDTGSAVTVDTGSLMVIGSVSSNTLTFTKGDGSQFSLTVDTGSAVTTDTGSLLVTASISDATITFTKGDASTFDITVNNVQNASTASLAITADNATSASHAINADNAISASFATTASFALNAPFGTNATASFTGSTWTFNHNLNKDYVIIDCYDSNNEEIIPQTIDLTTVNQAVISFPVSVQGTAVASLGNGVTQGSFSPISEFSILQSDATSTYTQKLDITATGTYNIHVSQSGVYRVDAEGLASGTTANLNIYVYPDLMTTPGTQAAVLFTYLSGSGTAVGYRTILSASASTVVYNNGINFGSSTTNLTRQSNNSVRNWGSAATNPTIFTRAKDGTFYTSVSAQPIPSLVYFFIGSQGTPIP